MYFPVYRQGAATDTVDHRRTALIGFVYRPIRMDDFINRTLGTLPSDIAFEINAGSAPTADNLMFRTVQTGKMTLPAGYWLPEFCSVCLFPTDPGHAADAQLCGTVGAEDDPEVAGERRSLQKHVGPRHLPTVTVVGDGREAVAAVTETASQLDIILRDLQMPVMDGYESTRLIRKQWSSDRLPIIAMTAYASRDELEHCLKSGRNDHLTKPVQPERLYACLVHTLRELAVAGRQQDLSARRADAPAGRIHH